MASIKDYAVPALIGAVISLFMDKFVVSYIRVALNSGEMQASLENMDKTFKAALLMVEKFDPSVFRVWSQRSEQLAGRASTMLQEHRGFSRLNVFSRHRRIKNIANLISEMDKDLKLLFLVLLKGVLSLILNKRRLPVVFRSSAETVDVGVRSNEIAAAFLGWATTTGFDSIFSFIWRLLNFNKMLRYLTGLMNEIDPFVRDCQRMLEQIDENRSDNLLNDAREWLQDMAAIIDEGRRISDVGSAIVRYKNGGQITRLTSRIEANLNKLLWITLVLLFPEIEGLTGRPLMPAGTPSTVSQETLFSGETEGWSGETVGWARDPTAPQETEAAPPQDVSIDMT